MATAAVPGKAAPASPPKRPYDERRLQLASISQGEIMSLTLPDAEEITEGLQDCERFLIVGPKLFMGQWLEVSNDAGSYYALMRVEFVHGGRGQGLTALSLRFIAPPSRSDRTAETPSATGQFYVFWGGNFRKFCVIAPNGMIRAEGITTQAEARNRCNELQNNAGVFRK